MVRISETLQSLAIAAPRIELIRVVRIACEIMDGIKKPTRCTWKKKSSPEKLENRLSNILAKLFYICVAMLKLQLQSD